MIDIDELEQLAKAATPGPWVSYTPVSAAVNPFEATLVAGPIPRYMDRSQGFCPADGNYIGVLDPATILSLTAEIRQLRAELAACGDLNAEVVGLRSYKEMAQMQVYELMGIVVDIEQFGSGFDDACMNTVKRVMGVFSGKDLP